MEVFEKFKVERSLGYDTNCQHYKREFIILKLDFTKAFDTIEHSIVLQMMHHLGFSDKWTD